jgi:hypothetical protein
MAEALSDGDDSRQREHIVYRTARKGPTPITFTLMLAMTIPSRD